MGAQRRRRTDQPGDGLGIAAVAPRDGPRLIGEQLVAQAVRPVGQLAALGCAIVADRLVVLPSTLAIEPSGIARPSVSSTSRC